LNEKAFEVLSYLEKSAPNIKFDATFSNQLEQDLDRIVAGNVKASDVIKQYIADVIPEAHDIQEQWWIDSLIGEEPEKLMFLEKEEEKQDTLISLKILDVDRYLSPHDPYRLLKLFLDACIENNSNNHILFSTKKDSQHRIIKASVIQSLLNIKCSVVFLTQLRFNYVFQWLVGLEPLHEIWKATVYDKVRHEPIILDATINILNLLKNDDNMLKVTEKLGFS
jgi:hypothetical protein